MFNIDSKNGNFSKELTEEECMALLPPGAPRSRSIFSPGFYFNGRGIKFRRGFWAALIPPLPPLFFAFIILFLQGFIAKIFAIPCFKKGELETGITICTVLFTGNILYFLFVMCVVIEFDLNKQTIRHGFLREQTKFETISEICISKARKGKGGANTTISLMSESNPYILLEYFPIWEEDCYVEIYKNYLLCILSRKLKVKYYLDGKLLKTEGDLDV